MRNVGFFLLAFGLGFWAHLAAEGPGRATGIGGVFIASEDPKALKSWYERHLGMKMDEHGSMFEWKPRI